MANKTLLIEKEGNYIRPISHLYVKYFKKKFYIQNFDGEHYYLYREDVSAPEPSEWEGILNPWFCSTPPVSHRFRKMDINEINRLIKIDYIDVEKSK